ncbi:hypothetical protein [Vitiosangium sp. GDMCC 1.1324]|uniref:hypothetical protein n=1 Tax=Vitiosangium sp. (strain GDMCC 1.1324) TaxID=2138576 RepID=UPI00130EA838|nr:hypothetical protein [Vitiosangium sp. GDMCC 1.1324]
MRTSPWAVLLPCLCPALGGAMRLAEDGTLLHPESDGTLRPGTYASLGLGVDNAR